MTLIEIIAKYVYLDHKENHAVKKQLESCKSLDEAFKIMENNFLLTNYIVAQIKNDVENHKK